MERRVRGEGKGGSGERVGEGLGSEGKGREGEGEMACWNIPFPMESQPFYT